MTSFSTCAAPCNRVIKTEIGWRLHMWWSHRNHRLCTARDPEYPTVLCNQWSHHRGMHKGLTGKWKRGGRE